MEINPNFVPGSIQPVSERYGDPDAPATGSSESPRTGSTMARISPLGSLISSMPELSTDQQEELLGFRDEMRAALTSGTFDAAEMAGKAPEFMQRHAAESGVSLAEAFEGLEDRLQSLQALKARLGGIDANTTLNPGGMDLLQTLLAVSEPEE
ncbi:MAG: hypothetical protein AAFS02_06605 [Pseudomonadota bacterium]